MLPTLERALYPIEYSVEVSAAAEAYHLPRNLILAVIREESHFDPTSHSRASAVGLMQLLPSTSQWIAGKRNLSYDPGQMQQPAINIDYGSWYLRYLIDQLKTDTLAIEAYNAGITNVREWEKQNPGYIGFAETDQFVRKVTASKKAYDQIYGENWERK